MHIVFEMKHNVHMLLICIDKHDFGSNKFTYDRMYIKGTIQQQQQYLSIGHLQQSTHVIDFK
jgi:hypothetical protein